jgi:preprotein translocase subunit SecD
VLTKSTAGDTSFYVADPIIISDEDIQEARATRTDDGLVITVRLTKAAISRLANVTDEHLGERLGVFLDGDLASTPVIAQPLKGSPDRRFVMGFRLSLADADRIAAVVSARWPRAH